jgi:tripartite-type tricarboxylate transporter receptor subunit TctC
MTIPRRRFMHLAAGAIALPALPSGARAQTYPTRPITLIVPFNAGGPADLVARVVGEHMSRTLGQQIVIENVVGAGGTTGSTRAMRATPDGYTITFRSVPMPLLSPFTPTSLTSQMLISHRSGSWSIRPS